MLLDILLTLFLVALNGFFVAAEFAMVKVRASQLEARGEGTPSRTNRAARHILHHLDAYLSATQLGITLASLGLGFVGEEVVAQVLIRTFGAMGTGWGPETAHAVALPVSFALITVLHIVFGELAPKSLAIRHPLPTTLWVALPMQVFYWVFRPFIWGLNRVANAVLRLLGVTPLQGHGDSHSEDELRYIVAESQRAGAINTSESELIERVFAFDDRIVRQVMVPRTDIFAVDIEDGPEAIVDQVLEQAYSRVPVYRGTVDNIIGILYVKDLLRWVRQGTVHQLAQGLRPAHYVPGSKHIRSLLRELQVNRNHVAIVLDEYGGTAGLVTLEDIVEELVGQIYDEHDATPQAAPTATAATPNEFVVSAQVSILDLNEFLPEPLPPSREHSTLAGLLLDAFRRLPRPGDETPLGPYQATVLATQPHRIERVALRLATPAPA
jgi:CBS domain containing-hemolysin-like protein